MNSSDQSVVRRALLRSKKIAAAASLLILVVIGSSMLLLAKKEPSTNLANKNAATPDISTQFDPSKYQQITGLKGATFWTPKEWTLGSTYSPGTSALSLFNYEPANIEAELRADGRYPQNANFYHDVPDRKLETYPFSLDKLYEIQVLHRSIFAPAPLSRSSLERSSMSNIQDLQLYEVNRRLVADYIQLGEGNFLDQRIILVRDRSGGNEIRITINPNESRDRITKDNFDGLIEFVGSITFSESR